MNYKIVSNECAFSWFLRTAPEIRRLYGIRGQYRDVKTPPRLYPETVQSIQHNFSTIHVNLISIPGLGLCVSRPLRILDSKFQDYGTARF